MDTHSPNIIDVQVKIKFDSCQKQDNEAQVEHNWNDPLVWGLRPPRYS